MIQFKVENVAFYIDENQVQSNNINIKSLFKNYQVNFQYFDNNFDQNDFLIVDKCISELYLITHKNMFLIEADQNNKTLETVNCIVQKMLEIGITNPSRVIVIGGGLTQDVGAFVSKVYKRGISWIFYPTTLLAMADSCIGGKCALNSDNFKNQISLFSAPAQVNIDINFLRTLPQQQMINGYGQIVKMFIIGGRYFIDKLDMNIEILIKYSLLIKKQIIQYDEYETNIRRVLNYGHTFGHAIEGYSNFGIPHGQAVLYGIEFINLLYSKLPPISKLISKYIEYYKVETYPLVNLIPYVLQDKKVVGNQIVMVVPEDLGNMKFKMVNLTQL